MAAGKPGAAEDVVAVGTTTALDQDRRDHPTGGEASAPGRRGGELRSEGGADDELVRVVEVGERLVVADVEGVKLSVGRGGTAAVLSVIDALGPGPARSELEGATGVAAGLHHERVVAGVYVREDVGDGAEGGVEAPGV